ncbi:MAG: heavy metal-binding domain-containing protein [Cyclobacteriaceae bacterium]
MKIVKTLNVLFVSILFLSACDGRKESADTSSDSTVIQNYICPMHPEVKGKEGDTCPKCGMNLEKTETKDSAEYVMLFKAEPFVEVGKSATFTFTPEIKDHFDESVSLEIQHEKKIHLIVVSKDLAYFDHVHPQANDNGDYEVKVLAKGEKFSNGKFQNETHFDQGGDYVLFADYLPTGASHQLERIELHVDGNPYKPVQFTKEKLVSTVDGYEVSLSTKDGKFLSGNASHIAAIIKKDGKEISAETFDNYLSAKAHVVMISEDTKDYLHVHPEVSNGRLDLHTTFEKTGIFRGWLQFKSNGEVHTADFVIKVEQGTAASEKPSEHHH